VRAIWLNVYDFIEQLEPIELICVCRYERWPRAGVILSSPPSWPQPSFFTPLYKDSGCAFAWDKKFTKLVIMMFWLYRCLYGRLSYVISRG
jgi:hypothetical protein